MKIVYLLTLVIPFIGFSQKDWKLAKDKADIKIWVRDYQNSSYKEFKATTYITTSIDKVVDELLHAPQYVENCEEGVSHLVGVNQNNEHIFYARNEFAWPIKDRDVVSRIRVEKISSNKIKLFIKAAPNELPLVEKTLRIHDLVGFWLLEKDAMGVKITQQLYINPEGTLPPFITNSLLVTGPYKTFLMLRDKLQRQDS
ncbi:hypothetical protein M0D21_18615 [Aquimarina sp. D1M17]|uniref:hypothetical protein n=1 Tax=Aquimarina acroporae TaxID=2937283 RepID=UPI0020BD7AF2|nr:hypothetical protein [Aquimarina acroporae]MCK8523603.1 hypothetical protein [Aquimarina acroporae]